ncbi:MAG: hypothetical protein QOI55_1608, partial [Actinomycetota bacterium]|nr:hypothetical protein [Actinomycetota bacterium]
RRVRSVPPSRWQAIAVVAWADPSRTPARFAAAALVAVLVAGCSGGGKHARPDTSAPSTQGTNAKPAVLALGSIDIQTWGAEVKLSKETKKKLLGLAQRYFDTAVHDPLGSGKVGAGYAALFEKNLRTTATGRDEKALTDIALGQSKYSETASKVKISGLADNTGALLYLATNFSVRVDATTAKGRVRIARDVELTYAPSGKNWLVTAYRVKTVRKQPKAKTTTTVAAGGGTTTP